MSLILNFVWQQGPGQFAFQQNSSSGQFSYNQIPFRIMFPNKVHFFEVNGIHLLQNTRLPTTHKELILVGLIYILILFVILCRKLMLENLTVIVLQQVWKNHFQMIFQFSSKEKKECFTFTMLECYSQLHLGSTIRNSDFIFQFSIKISFFQPNSFQPDSDLFLLF